MMTNDGVKAQMMSSLRSPQDLCLRLGLNPSPEQNDLMQRFLEGVPCLDVAESPDDQACKALAMCALWRLLLEPGSQCIVISSARDLENRFVRFLQELTTAVDPALASVCRWKHSRRMQVGHDPRHVLRAVSNRPAFFQGLHGPVTFVVLGARSSERQFMETLKVVNSYRGQLGARHVCMW